MTTSCIVCGKQLDGNNKDRVNKTGRCRACNMKAIGPKKGTRTGHPVAHCEECGIFNIYPSNKSGYCWRCSKAMERASYGGRDERAIDGYL